MPWIIRINLVFLFLFCVIFFLPLDTFTATRIIRSFIELSFILFLPGINLAFLIQYFLKKKFSLLEFINIALVFSLFLLPFLLTIEYTELKTLIPYLPFITALLIFIIIARIYFFHKKRNLESIQEFPLNNKDLLGTFFSKNFLPPFILYITVVISIITAYYPLPDLDPYYWITEYRTQLQTETITTLNGHRPLFSSLTHIFTQGAHIDFYAYFKYVLPALLLFLIFPTALLAQKFSHPLQKVIVFFFPFASGITVIYLTLPIPQALANIGLFFFFAFLTYSLITGNTFFYFLGGAVLFFSFFYHEALAIPLALWILFSLWNYRREIFQKVRENRLTTFLLLFITLPAFYSPILFIFSHIESLLSALLNSQPNLLFPQYYVNIDGNQMGWGDFFGVAKYYLFYIGPPLLLTFVTLLYFIKNKIVRSFLFSQEGKVLTCIFLVFFIIAEILPRLTGIALLPDRAWVFAGTIALFFLIPLFSLPIGKNQFFLWIIILGFSANIAAAIYINTLKKYMITEPQLVSAEWINTNLPNNRTIFTVESGRLLSFFSGSSVIKVGDPNFLFDETVFESEFKSRQIPFSEADQKKAIESLKTTVENIDTENVTSNVQVARNILSQIELIEQAKNTTEEMVSKNKSYYIYYAAPSEKNPYVDRPYMKKFENKEKHIIFNQQSDYFEKVYSDEANHIYIWKIIQ
ncbi:MAG: hypothetical protein PHH40_01310 [Candidatus Moranbacteria bacterium]|nr:hypothetical protein [Candidatus Moranbacteria bacterium]MDD3964951.1 hypothetical protein [Candidatus Moranbacteria bacterium]